jgi:protocatechuate 3,4-dioxygenase beta subunit
MGGNPPDKTGAGSIPVTLNKERTAYMAEYAKFFFRPADGEHIRTVVTPEPDERAVITGRVVDSREHAMENAVVLLFRAVDGEPPELLSRCCTDEDGHFVFGPLEGGKLYLVKVHKDGGRNRELEIQTE